MDHFETMHTCCGYIEDVHVNFSRGKIILDKISAFWTYSSLVILDVARCSLCLFTLYINIKIGKNSC